jgi:hypothetical protein
MSQLTLLDKAKILKEKATNPQISQRKLASDYNVSVSTVNRLLKRKIEIDNLMEENFNVKRMRKLRATPNQQLNKIMDEFWRVMRIKKLPLTGTILQGAALKYAADMILTDFKASEGWLRHFKSRHSIKFKRVCGEAGDVNIDTVENWKLKLPIICDGYEPKDIFNADETGLFFKALPNKTLAEKDDVCVGGKLSKERVTILFCANAVGEKLRPLVIGKSKQPRSFNKLKHNQLPVNWRWSFKAWMTGDIFEDWLKELNNRMLFERRKILLLIDNATVHQEIELSNMKIYFFPPNATSILQPMDQGIIKNFKAHYRNLMINKLLNSVEHDNESAYSMVKRINILESLYWIKTAWSAVKSETIVNCFKHAGFLQHYVSNSVDNFSVENYSVCENFNSSFKTILPDLSVEDLINFDNNIETCDNLLDENAEQMRVRVMKNVIDEIDFLEVEDDNETSGDDGLVQEVCTEKQMKDCIYKLKDYFMLKCPDLVDDICNLESKVMSQQFTKQTTIMEYFNKA